MATLIITKPSSAKELAATFARGDNKSIAEILSRSHLQPIGRKTQWFDVLHDSPDGTLAYRAGDFRPVEISITPAAETRALAS